MYSNVNAAQQRPIILNGQPIEEVDSFTYLGSIVSKSGGTDEDVRARIAKARHAFVILKPVWRNVNLHLSTKLRLFNTNVKSVLLYGAETWRNTKSIDHKLQVFINTCLRQILRIRWPERISNQELWQRTRQEPITITIKNRKWRWIYTPCAEGRTASPAMPWIGTRKASARGADQSRPGAERWTQS